LLPAHDVRPYVQRNKTDRADAAGLLEAARCGSIRPVPVKTPEQQGIQGLHRVREFPKAQFTAAIDLLRDFGVVIPLGSAKVRHVRRFGRVTKRGNVYLRMLLIHGARAMLRSAKLAAKKQQPLDRTRAWALALSERVGHNKAAFALANKTALRLWATEHHRQSFDPDHVSEPLPH
jgi:transposase